MGVRNLHVREDKYVKRCKKYQVVLYNDLVCFLFDLGFWSGDLFLVAPFPDLCLLVPLCISIKLETTFSFFYLKSDNGQTPVQSEPSVSCMKCILFECQCVLCLDDGFLDAREFASAPWDFGCKYTSLSVLSIGKTCPLNAYPLKPHFI